MQSLGIYIRLVRRLCCGGGNGGTGSAAPYREGSPPALCRQRVLSDGLRLSTEAESGAGAGGEARVSPVRRRGAHSHRVPQRPGADHPPLRLHRFPGGNHRTYPLRRGEPAGGKAGHHGKRYGAALRLCHRLSDLRRTVPGSLAGRKGEKLHRRPVRYDAGSRHPENQAHPGECRGVHCPGGAAEGGADAGEKGLHRRGRHHHRLPRGEVLGYGAPRPLYMPGDPAENRPGDGHPGSQGGLPHSRIPGRRLLPQRKENLPPGPEPASVLPLCGLRRSRTAPAGGREDSEAGAVLRGGAHLPLSPEPVFY